MSAMTVPPYNNPQSDSHHGRGISRTEKIILLICFIIALVYAGVKYQQSNHISVELGEDIPHGSGGIVVQIEGAVQSPGVVYLPAGSKVSDAVEAANGFTSDADVSSVDLSRFLTDGERVVIPSNGSGQGNANGSGSSDVIRSDPGSVLVENPFPNRSGDAATSGKININTASSNELQTLPGIGEELASRILQYRRTHTAFDSIEDIMLVEGIGEGKFEDIRDLITVRD